MLSIMATLALPSLPLSLGANGYVAEVSYEGAPTYPQTTAVVAQPAVSVARSPLGESTAQATSYLV